jgi:hypothetical protein
VRHLVSVEGVSESKRCFGAFISARKIPFPENGDSGTGSNPRLLGDAVATLGRGFVPTPPNAVAFGSGAYMRVRAREG